MAVGARLRSLDRRVLREDGIKTPEGWRKAASRWWVLLVVAGFYSVLVVVLAAVLDIGGRASGLGGLLVVIIAASFESGRLKSEHDRLTGRDPFERRRPPGL